MRLFLFAVHLIFAEVVIAQQFNYYFGNLHAHTGFSDGTKDSLISDISTPVEAYTYARMSKDFNFLGISEHNHYSNSKNPGFKRPLYKRGLEMAEQCTEENEFLALFGMEYGISSGRNGHVIIYGFDSLIGWEESVPGIVGNNYDIFNAKSDYDALFKKVKDRPGAFCYLAHPYLSDYSSNGTEAGALLSFPYQAAYDSAIVGVPLRSGLATSRSENYNEYPKGNYFDYYLSLLSKGYHVGIGYDHDNHYSNFGRSNGGRLVIIAPSLTKENLTYAMQHMHFYGSDDSNAEVEFRLGEHIMGSVFSGSEFPQVKITHHDPEGEMADSIKIWRGCVNKICAGAEIIHLSKKANSCYLKDSTIASGIEYYYFAEIKQEDAQWIVTSPIWYTKTETIQKADTECQINFFYNPTSKQLEFNGCGNQEVLIFDVLGRILKSWSPQKEDSVDLSNFPPGIYTLFISSPGSSFSRKLLVE